MQPGSRWVVGSTSALNTSRASSSLPGLVLSVPTTMISGMCSPASTGSIGKGRERCGAGRYRCSPGCSFRVREVGDRACDGLGSDADGLRQRRVRKWMLRPISSASAQTRARVRSRRARRRWARPYPRPAGGGSRDPPAAWSCLRRGRGRAHARQGPGKLPSSAIPWALALASVSARPIQATSGSV